MALENCTSQMAHIIMELLPMAMRKVKEDLSSREEPFMKDKLDIMLHREKVFLSTICKNTGTWETGLMICPTEKVKKPGETALHTRANF